MDRAKARSKGISKKGLLGNADEIEQSLCSDRGLDLSSFGVVAIGADVRSFAMDSALLD